MTVPTLVHAVFDAYLEAVDAEVAKAARGGA